MRTLQWGTVDVVYLDFQKAFDKMPQQRLLHKIKVHGVTGNVLAWIEDWLTNITESKEWG